MVVDISRRAEQCAVVSRARRLAAWVGAGRPVTAKGVLRRADVAEAGKVIGVRLPAWVRTAADVEELHHPWVVAQAAGWLTVDNNRAAAGPDTDGDPLRVWLAGLDAVLRVESRDPRRCGAAMACRAVLAALAADPPPARERVEDAVGHMLDGYDVGDATAVFQAFRQSVMPVDAALAVLAEFGAVDDEARLTPLGRWAAEHAPAALARDGAEAAYHEVGEHGGLDAVPASGHPGENVPREAVAGVAASGLRPHVFQVKIALSRVRPPVWRRVLVPPSATLGDLHSVIRAVLGWGDDHLHAFTADGARYSDPSYGMSNLFYGTTEYGDENAVLLSRVLPRVGAVFTYVYDFGDWWEHTITLEKVVDADEAVAYPTCLAGRGDAIVEDWNPDDPEEPTPFDRDDINRRLAALADG